MKNDLIYIFPIVQTFILHCTVRKSYVYLYNMSLNQHARDMGAIAWFQHSRDFVLCNYATNKHSHVNAYNDKARYKYLMTRENITRWIMTRQNDLDHPNSCVPCKGNSSSHFQCVRIHQVGFANYFKCEILVLWWWDCHWRDMITCAGRHVSIYSLVRWHYCIGTVWPRLKESEWI